MNIPHLLARLTLALLSTLCVATTFAAEGPIRVEIVRDGQTWAFLRGGEPFEINGASGFSYLDEAKAAGVTVIRTWGDKHLEGGKLLDEAHQRGLTVLVGLWFGHKRDGFDYADPAMVQKQHDELAAVVMKYKDHPAVFAWGVGNEAEARGGQPWEAINALAAFIKEVDPNHPTVCVIAGAHVDRIEAMKNRSPMIDVLGINTYRGYAGVAENVTKARWEGPYFVTEMGNNGTWEAPKTEWGAPIEPASGPKARLYAERYKKLAADPRCLGIFPFHWGYVPKGTSTWFSLFHANGEPNAVVDTLHHIWKGSWPEHRAPLVEEIELEGKAAEDSVRVKAGATCTAVVEYAQPGGEPVTTSWELRPESKITAAQGRQAIAQALDDTQFEPLSQGEVSFTAPSEPGAYRLHFTARTAAGKIGSANFPFHVDP